MTRPVTSPADRPLPELRGGQFVLDGRPALLLGGQLHNSLPSSPAHVVDALRHVRGMHVGMVVGSANWAQVEPTEGVFDFDTVDAQLREARKNDLRLVLIWFGAFKNAASTYAPRWVRADTTRYPRAKLRPNPDTAWTYAGQTHKPVLSVFSRDLRDSDQRAFCRLMDHLAEHDTDHTVVMVQVENEVGVLGDSRDRSSVATDAWNADVPARLLDHLKGVDESASPLLESWTRKGRRTIGSWPQVFGESLDVDEAFMAWAFADYCESLAGAGKAIKALPMYANAWLGPQPGQPEPGDYPSGGPAERVLDIWKVAAPSLDLLAPDLYVDDVKPVLEGYVRDDNPLFIPEARFRTGTLFYVLGHHRAVGFSVFGVEDGLEDSQLAHAYRLLRPMQDVLIEAQQLGRIEGVLLDAGQVETVSLGGYDLTVRGSRELLNQLLLDAGVPHPPPAPVMPSETTGADAAPSPADDRPFALVIWQEDDTFLLVGQGVTVDFTHPTDQVEIDTMEEGRYEDGSWRPGRMLNGDERLYAVPMSSLGMARITVLSVARDQL